MKDKLIILKPLIETSNEAAEQIGNKIAKTFKLKKDPKRSGYYQSHGGATAAVGVARQVLKLIEAAGFDLGNDNIADNLVETFELKTDPLNKRCYSTAEGSKTLPEITKLAAKVIVDEARKLPNKEYLIWSPSGPGFLSKDKMWGNDLALALQFSADEACQPVDMASTPDAEWVHVSRASEFEMGENFTPA